jgi:hypothetical protein
MWVSLFLGIGVCLTGDEVFELLTPRNGSVPLLQFREEILIKN